MAAVIFGLILCIIVDVSYGIQRKDMLIGSHPKRLKITFGSPVKITDHPYMAQYRAFNESVRCGAAIINEQFLVTAAHCVIVREDYDDIAHPYRITVGQDKKSVTGGEDYEIEKTRVNFLFINSMLNGVLEYDIAVIKLKKNITFNDRVKPIKMADQDYELNNGDVLTTIGFGQTETGLSPPTLLGVNLTYIDHKTCQKKFKDFDEKVTGRMLCAMGKKRKSSCHGDSGGPIVHNGVLVGLTSWGNPFCGTSCDKLLHWPGVYARISALRSFIESSMEELRNNNS